jgi:hypothetical protein
MARITPTAEIVNWRTGMVFSKRSFEDPLKVLLQLGGLRHDRDYLLRRLVIENTSPKLLNSV